MEKIKIFFAYHHTEKPWGGANNFVKALFNELSRDSSYIVHHDIHQESDILFFSQLSTGPGNVEKGIAKRYSYSYIKKKKRETGAKLVVRAVNLNINSHPPKGLMSIWLYLRNGLWLDIETLKLVNLADFVIFQSVFQKSFFKRWGYRGKNDVIIHNGAPPVFSNENFYSDSAHAPLRLVSNSNYKTFKRHEVIAKVSQLEGVNVTHIGTWSPKIKNHQIDLKGTLSHEQIVEVYKKADYLLHPAINDPCPNAVIEALHYGLPVLYNNGAGSSTEIVRGNGIVINENKLEETIQLAQTKFFQLKEKLRSDRDYYSIKRAVLEYKKIFNHLKNK